MSSSTTFSTSDLRSHAQDYKRDAAHKHKWAFGAIPAVDGTAAKPRPQRPSRTDFNHPKRREAHDGIAALAQSPRIPRKHDMLNDTDISDESSVSNSDNDEGVPGVMYSFDAARGPSHGSQILTLALSKAVERFEERETVKLVRSEYDVLDSDGESVAAAAEKKRKGKGKRAATGLPTVAQEAEEDYEFV